MNIHFTSKELKEQLQESTIFKIEVGSGMYGLKNDSSDTDILCIYLDGKYNLTSFTENHHQFQYKDIENNIDYIFTSLNQFIKNILSGDSTINYEVLKSKEFQEKFPELSNIKYNINVVKSYLGIAKRDFKILKKDFSNKKLYHFVRGVEFAEAVLKDVDIFETLKENFDNLKNVRNNQTLNEHSVIVSFYGNKMESLKLEIKDNNEKLSSTEAYIINKNIIKYYEQYKEKQKDFINYGNLIEEAIYNEKFNY